MVGSTFFIMKLPSTLRLLLIRIENRKNLVTGEFIASAGNDATFFLHLLHDCNMPGEPFCLRPAHCVQVPVSLEGRK